MSKPPATLAERLAKALAELPGARTQADLAKACKVKPPSVSAWFSGETAKLKSDTLIRASLFLQVSPQWLLDGTGPMRSARANFGTMLDVHGGFDASEHSTVTERAHAGSPAETSSLPRHAPPTLAEALPTVLDGLSSLTPGKWAMVRARLDALPGRPENTAEVLADVAPVLGVKIDLADLLARAGEVETAAFVKPKAAV